jgi:hypothetical protein
MNSACTRGQASWAAGRAVGTHASTPPRPALRKVERPLLLSFALLLCGPLLLAHRFRALRARKGEGERARERQKRGRVSRFSRMRGHEFRGMTRWLESRPRIVRAVLRSGALLLAMASLPLADSFHSPGTAAGLRLRRQPALRRCSLKSLPRMQGAESSIPGTWCLTTMIEVGSALAAPRWHGSSLAGKIFGLGALRFHESRLTQRAVALRRTRSLAPSSSRSTPTGQ